MPTLQTKRSSKDLEQIFGFLVLLCFAKAQKLRILPRTRLYVTLLSTSYNSRRPMTGVGMTSTLL